MVGIESLDVKPTEKPILFSTPMVQAILDDRKTKTRRVAKIVFLPGFNPEWTGYRPVLENGKFFLEGSNHRQATTQVKIPYQVGDVLWVRETWNHFNYDNDHDDKHLSGYIYKASPELVNDLPPLVQTYYGVAWKPSIHMPRKAARLFLRVKNVRVERLQDITEDDARAEGVKGIPRSRELYPTDDYIYPFKSLWDSLNAKRGFEWDLNPWVWVIEFERIEDYENQS